MWMFTSSCVCMCYEQKGIMFGFYGSLGPFFRSIIGIYKCSALIHELVTLF